MITQRRKDILTFIKEYHDEHGWAPTLEEIGEGVGLVKSAVRYHVLLLEQDGYIIRSTTTPRTIAINDRSSRTKT